MTLKAAHDRPPFRSTLLAAKRRLAAGREKLKVQHAEGAPGIQICARLTALLDTVVLDLFNAAIDDLGLKRLRDQIALVPHGGYGRRALAPYSDVDLMILHSARDRPGTAALAQRLMQDIFDVGLDLGHSVRTAAEACRLAKNDVTVFTSLVESRWLDGSQDVYRRFHERFRRMTLHRQASRHAAILAARDEEEGQFGETVYLLEPNIKRSRGSLRDIHLLRWIGFAAHRAADPDQLHSIHALSAEDREVLAKGYEFLMWLRNELHFHADSAQDVLLRSEQLRLAEKLGYEGSEGLLPVEQFMQDYFHHTSQVRYLVSQFVESARPRMLVKRIAGPLFSHQVEGDYRVGPREIRATRRGLGKLKSDLVEVLRLADLANLYDKRIAHETWAAVHLAANEYSNEISDTVSQRFLSLMAQPARLGELLRRLHELGVLEKIIPAFRHARCLLQFNEYHKYTVDEHCIRAVECATEFALDPGPLGQVYRQLKQKRTLHLALLLHDLGKGFVEDHSELGRTIAGESASRLRIAPHDKEVIEFLVHKHLLMSHLAFRRNTYDEQLVLRFAVEVGSPEILRMLYLMTCADLSAVGPGVLNSWKVEVLTGLYDRAMRHLTAAAPGSPSQPQLAERRRDVVAKLKAEADDPWFARQIDALPAGMLLEQPPEKTAAALGRLKKLQPGEADAWARYVPESETVEFVVAVDHSLSDGLFYKLAGALTSHGLGILSAELNTLADGLVLDRFVAEDPDYASRPPRERLDSVCHALVESIHSPQAPKFRRIWGSDQPGGTRSLTPLATEVKVDNTTSDSHTILEVFTFDRRGLLYTIARTLYEMGLSIEVAKIGTYLDQVVDVFYVSDSSGKKIEDEARVEEIRGQLQRAIEAEP